MTLVLLDGEWIIAETGLTLQESLELEAKIYVVMSGIKHDLREWYRTWVYHHNTIEFIYEGYLATSRGPLGMLSPDRWVEVGFMPESGVSLV